VKRKAAKDHFKSYEKFFTVARTMAMAMEWKDFEQTAVEVINQHVTGFDWHNARGYYDPEREEKFKSIALAIKDVAPLDAYILYACADNYNVMARVTSVVAGGNYYTRQLSMQELYLSFHRRVTRDIYKATPELFKDVEYKAGDRYPANNWGIKVLVDGQQVTQY
jgi:hypothetical protein